MARQSLPIDVIAVAGLELTDEPIVAGGPVAPTDFVVAGTFFLLREIELAAAKVEHVKLSEDGLSVDWLLPTSKTDPRAVGVTRSWDCCCYVESFRPACPVCALKRQLDRASCAASRFSVAVGSFPLFFTLAGGECGKAAAVATLLGLVSLAALRDSRLWPAHDRCRY